MPVSEKFPREDYILYEVMTHPVLFGEFIRNIDRTPSEEKFEYAPYQKEFICDFNDYVSLCCGRSVGKTLTLTDIISWIMINQVFKGDYVVYTVPNKVHLDPVFSSLTRMFRTNSILRQFIDPKSGINSSNHTVKLLNYMSLDCRIAGTTGTGSNVVGMHSPFEILDEAGFYPWGTWIELQPTLNNWQKGYRQIVSGVPIGVREQNVLFYTDQADDKYSRHRISAHENPRYSKESDEENIIKYGGADSEDYIHHVLGQHGVPTFSVFDRNLMSVKSYPVYRIKIDGIKEETITDYYNKLSLIPGIDEKYDYTLLGIDLGYTDPTAIHILYSKDYVLKYHARIQLNKVLYSTQKKLIDFLDTKFNKFDIIGIDAGGPGRPVIDDLLQADEFIHKDYDKRLVPIDFSSQMLLGINADGEEIKTRMKPFSVSLTQEYVNSHKIVFSSTDFEFISELERMTYTKNPSGEIVYRTLTLKGGMRGEDHNTAALLSAMVAHYIKKDASVNKPKTKRLMSSSWLLGA